jgi:hypothetical protein
MRISPSGWGGLAECAAVMFLTHCGSASSTETEARAPDSSETTVASVKDGASIADAFLLDASDTRVLDVADRGAIDLADVGPVEIVDAGAVDVGDAAPVDVVDAGAVEHVVPDGIYDCDVVQIRCNGGGFTPQLAAPDHSILFSFNMTVTGNTVSIPPTYACNGSWYPAGTPVSVFGYSSPPDGGAAGLYDRGGFACQFPTEQGIVACDVGYSVTSSGGYFVVTPSDPNPARSGNADGGAVQPGEIYVGLIGNNSYNAHCAQRH